MDEMTQAGIDRRALRVALATRGWAQWRLAARLGIDPSTLSAAVGGRRLSPGRIDELRRGAERALGLADGALALTRAA